ncbi:MAG: hexitol phosphatase HxpB [Wenzhouxiangella sp.]|nr:MAG: hexitol phosphatase HxpB [Wenzhouxiangella sp.]
MNDLDAAIFDMDGLLIDSEPLWQDAEISCLGPLGVPVTRDLCRASAGQRLDEVLADWYQRFGWEGPNLEEMHGRVMEEVTRLILARGQALPGALEVIASMRAAGLKTAIASSSPPQLIDAVVKKLGIGPVLDLTHSGVDEERGKPDPAVFLSTARRLGVSPERCLVFEDAPAGVTAAHRAGMRVIAIPSVVGPDHPAFAVADQVLASLLDFNLSELPIA